LTIIPLGSFKTIFSNFLALCFPAISLMFGGISHPILAESPVQSSWTESFGFLDHTTLAQPSCKVFQSQVESFKFPVDQFCFASFASNAPLSESNSLILGWWQQRTLFFELSRVLFPFHFFW
jgi:hypothetical protein